MNRPTSIPDAVKTAITNDTGIAYTARQKLTASLTAWLNRDGPITRCPSAAVTRDIRAIDDFPGRREVAEAIDAMQTALVAVATAGTTDGLPPVSTLVGQLQRALNAHSWHP